MIYNSGNGWRYASEKRVLLFGMSGVGKTHLARILRSSGTWFHYSVDYRIGTRYMGEHIVDNFTREAMKNPFLANLLKSDSIDITSNISFTNLEPLSTFLSKPGNSNNGGISFNEYRRRQDLHRHGERSSLLDTLYFINRAKGLYNYDNFVCDTGGSICEVINPFDKSDNIMTQLADHLLPVWIKGSNDHIDRLLARFNKAPKPMYYNPDFLMKHWQAYCTTKNIVESEIDPDDFMRWLYFLAIKDREPRYKAMAENWGISISTDKLQNIENETDFVNLIAESLDRQLAHSRK